MSMFLEPKLGALAGSALAERGSLVTRADLEAAGLTRRTIERLVADGDIVRVFRGRYVPRGLDDEYVSAARLGARLTGPSLFAKLGAWRSNTDQRLHISVPRNGLRPVVDPQRIHVHWSAYPGIFLAEPLDSAVSHVVKALSRDECVAVLDSVVRRGIMAPSAVAVALKNCATQGGAAVSLRMDASAESGAESLLRLWLRARGISYRSQVRFGAFRVDFLVGSRLVIEVVGEQYHADARSFEADCVREAYLQGLGLQVLRLSARQVFSRMDDAGAVVLAMLRRRQHVRGPQVRAASDPACP